MRATFDHLHHIMSRANSVSGVFMEIGVWKGDTLIPAAKHYTGRQFVGVDSFEGMAEPTERDFDDSGKTKFPKGALNAQGFIAENYPPNVKIIQGWVPFVLDKIEVGPIAFCHLDLDQYLPTCQAMTWAWERMAKGGVLACHDWFPEQETLATGAIKDIAKLDNMQILTDPFAPQFCYFIKG